ncbi:replication protein A subunit RPA32, partial [Polyporus arcularius HHB13444]
DSPFYGGGGGGYLSQGSPFGSGGGSPGGSTRPATSHSIRPVTLRQLAEASQEHSDAPWKIGEQEVGQVMVVAAVLSVQAQTTNVVYLLDDGTANYEARQWVDPNSDDETKREISESSYVRVLGSLKMFGQKRYITATHIREIARETVADELMHHIANVATTELIFERGPPPRPSEGGVVKNANAVNTGSAPSASAYTAGARSTANNNAYASLSPLQRQIVDFMLSQPKTDEGIHVAAIARHVASSGGVGDANLIRLLSSKALDELMDDGHVYTTIDESHFLVSE